MLQIGSLVDGKYKILNKVGQGGMSVVYLAMNEKANKQWAVKEVRKDGVKDFEVVKQGLVAETDILKKLSHPNLPSIIDVIDTNDSFIIIMDYIQGNSLNKALDEYGAQPQENVILWAKQLCDVLGYLHSRNPAIIYRDMKPANIMLKPDGNITLIDFGTAREYKEKNLADTTCLGTVGYAAPEQFGGHGQTDARTDIYGLGATLYHLVTGKNPCEPPYEIRPIRDINPSLSGGLERIILKCTQRDPADRYQSAAELMYALEHFEEIDDVYRKKQKRKLAAFAATTALTVLFGAASVWGYASAERQKNANYNTMLERAASVQDYYKVILTDPARVEAYTAFNKYLVEDKNLSKEDIEALNKLRGGLDPGKNAKGYNQDAVDVLARLKAANPEGYRDLCMDIGWSYLSWVENNSVLAQYSGAKQWLQYVQDDQTEDGRLAALFCDIADCLKNVEDLRGAKLQRPEDARKKKTELWTKIQELQGRADQLEVDYRINAWGMVNKLINANIDQLLDVTQPEALLRVLGSIQSGVDKVDDSVNSELRKMVADLRADVEKTIARVETTMKED